MTRQGEKFLKIKEGSFRMDIKKAFFTKRVVMCCNRLLRQAVDAPSVDVLETILDGALGNLI